MVHTIKQIQEADRLVCRLPNRHIKPFDTSTWHGYQKGFAQESYNLVTEKENPN